MFITVASWKTCFCLPRKVGIKSGELHGASWQHQQVLSQFDLAFKIVALVRLHHCEDCFNEDTDEQFFA